MNCSLCENPIASGRDQTYRFSGNLRPVCPECRAAIDDLTPFRKERRELAKEYLLTQMKTHQYPPDINTGLMTLLEMKPDSKKADTGSDTGKSGSNSWHTAVFCIFGVIFLILAIILFFMSSRKLDPKSAEVLGIDSIMILQPTIYCSTCFFISVINFICAIMVNAINRNRN